jgi:hypothetical protein
VDLCLQVAAAVQQSLKLMEQVAFSHMIFVDGGGAS